MSVKHVRRASQLAPRTTFFDEHDAATDPEEKRWRPQRASDRLGAESPSIRGRRQDYIDAAARVFHRRGYDSATVGDIAEELDVTKAALHYYFNSKEELLYEIIREMHEINLGNLAIAEANAGDARTRLWNYFAGHARVNLKYFIQSSVAYRDLDHLGPENRQDVVALRDKTQAFVRRLLSEAADEGVVCTLADLDLASIAMFTTVNAVHIWYHPGGPMDHDEAARSIADFVVAGVLCRGTGTWPAHGTTHCLPGTSVQSHVTLPSQVAADQPGPDPSPQWSLDIPAPLQAHLPSV